MDFQTPIATVDIVLLCLREARLTVALYRREQAPFAGAPALPGGYVHVDEDADLAATARRVLASKTGLDGAYLEQLAVFSGRERDPRGWSLSVAHVALMPADRIAARGAPVLAPVDALPDDLAFDHARIVEAAVARVRNKAVYSTLPTFLMDETFTIAELCETYRLVLGVARLDPAGFRKKMLDLKAIEPVDGAVRTGAHRPAQLYRRADAGLALFDRTI
jgi:8-oxo-dGTP diphosphatase